MSKAVVGFDTLMKNVNDQVRPLMAHVDEVSGSARATMGEMQRTIARVGPVTESAIKDYQTLAQDMQKLTVSLDAKLSKTLVQLQVAIAAVDGAINADSPPRYDLANALREVQEAARSLRALSDYLERHPESIITGKRAEGAR